MTKPIAPQRPSLSARATLQVVLGAALATTLLTHATAQAAEASTGAVMVAPVAAPFATEASRAQPSTGEPDQPFTTEEWQLEQKRQVPETGRATRGWLQAQGNREQASANRPTLSGPALRRVNNRYLKTFEVEIPQQLRDSVPSNK